MKRSVKEFFDPDILKERLLTEVARRPYTVAFLGLFTLYALVNIWSPNFFDSTEVSILNLSLSLGFLMSLAAYQWKIDNIAQPLIVLALIAFTTSKLKNASLSDPEMIGYGAAYTALTVGIFFRPTKRGGDEQARAYTLISLSALAKSLLTAFVVSISILLIFSAVRILFGVDAFDLGATFITLLGGTVPALTFLSGLPLDKAEEVEEVVLSRFAKIVLLPLALTYMLVLYAYGIKILFTWSLPQGTITYMVSGITLASLLVLYAVRGYLYSPEADEKSKAIALAATRWLPILLLPLLVLMSVAIFYRIGEYGISPTRLYVAGFNLWAYAAVIYIIVRKGEDLNALACSFAVLFAAVSIIPGANFYSWGIHAVQSNVKQRLSAAGVKEFPITLPELKSTLNGLSKEQAEELAEDVEYLYSGRKHKDIEGIVELTDDEYISKWNLMNHREETILQKFNIDFRQLTVSPLPLASSVREITYTLRDIDTKIGTTDCIFADKDGELKINLPVDSLIEAYEAELPAAAIILPVENDDSKILAITGYTLRGYGDSLIRVELNGLLFEK
ncbi:MAG: DUF4153 domain-containing protein [Bacteroidales bacterium]|nr:DUF4153 domain-containing protein [Bacteroidales bacterium]